MQVWIFSQIVFSIKNCWIIYTFILSHFINCIYLHIRANIWKIFVPTFKVILFFNLWRCCCWSSLFNLFCFYYFSSIFEYYFIFLFCRLWCRCWFHPIWFIIHIKEENCIFFGNCNSALWYINCYYTISSTCIRSSINIYFLSRRWFCSSEYKC